MTREEAIMVVGEQAVNAVESEDCWFSGRILDNAPDHHELTASVPIGDGARLVVSYVITDDEADGDLDCIDWASRVYGYEVQG